MFESIGGSAAVANVSNAGESTKETRRSFGLCKYKNLFGEPNTGLRKYRIMNIAVLDTVVVVVFVAVLSWAFSWPFWWTLLAVFVLGIVVHRMFCVRTGIDQILFPNSDS